MQQPTDTHSTNRISIIIACVVVVISMFSITMTVFAWGMGDTTIFYLILYPTFLVVTILAIMKVRFAFILILIISIAYPILLTEEVGKYLVFNLDNYILFWILVLPYLTLIALVPMTVRYLTIGNKGARIYMIISIISAVGFLFYPIANRYDMDYPDSICMDFKIENNGLIKVIGKPNFGDSREFFVSTDSKKLAEVIKSEGELLYGSYVFVNTKIEKNFSFSQFRSFTVKQLDKKELDFKIKWNISEIKGDVSFLQP